MDMFTTAASIIVVMLSLQFEQNWLAFGTILLMIVSSRSITTAIVLIGALVFLFFTREAAGQYWLFVVFGLMLLAFFLDAHSKKSEAPSFGADFGGLGGMGGGF